QVQCMPSRRRMPDGGAAVAPGRFPARWVSLRPESPASDMRGPNPVVFLPRPPAPSPADARHSFGRTNKLMLDRGWHGGCPPPSGGAGPPRAAGGPSTASEASQRRTENGTDRTPVGHWVRLGGEG